MKSTLRTLALSASLFIAPLSAHAAEIMFAFVNDYIYAAEGHELAGWLGSGGHNVTVRHLNEATYTDYASFDQIFVYDLSAITDVNAHQTANYAGIASWYNGLSDQNLILDGRIISSASRWTNLSNGHGSGGEPEWIRNYRDQLDVRGGGLVLGTDHATAFTRGINEINAQIGVGAFTGFYHQAPYEAFVDSKSPLFVPQLENCSLDATQKCINDNSSTSFVATGLQANGQTLTPVAYHGGIAGAFDQAAVSTTMGSITFGTCGGAGQPACTVSAPGSLTLFGLGLLGLAIARRRVSAVVRG